MSEVVTVFMDRDGVLNAKPPEGDYVKHPDELRMLAGAAAAVARLNAASVRVILVTNQRGIGRGLMTEDDYRAVHARLCQNLAQCDAHLDAEYHCPDVDDASSCRKPNIGLFMLAVHDFPDIELSHAWVIGDSPADMDAGLQLRCTTIMIGNRGASASDYVVDNLAQAVGIVLTALT